MNMGAFPSGQWGQTVNLLLNASVVRIHQLPPKEIRNGGCGSFFVLELVGFEQVGRPKAASNSPADCCLDRGLANPPAPAKVLNVKTYVLSSRATPHNSRLTA